MAPRRTRNGPISVRRFDPDTGWSLDQARALIAQGYETAHVEQRTGWPRAMLLAPRARSSRVPS